jgi:hypothetical protein
MKSPELITEIKEYPALQVLLRIMCLAWLAFGGYKFTLNPVFFGISLLVAITAFLLITRMVITVTEDMLIIRHERILPLLSVELVYPLDEIEDIHLDMADLSIVARVPADISLLFPSARVVRAESLSIKRRGKPWKKFRLVGSNEQYKELVAIVKSRMDSSLKDTESD